MKKSSLNICLFYFIYYITFGAFSPYLNVYFEGLGFSGNQIGTLNSLGMIAGMIAAPLIGMIADKTKKTKLIISTLLVISAISLYAFSIQKTYVPILVTFIIFGIFKNDIGNLQDSIASKYCTNENLDFSKVRIFGSYGYLFGSFVLATILSYFGFEGPYLILMIICYILCVFILIFIPDEANEQKEKIAIIPATLKLLKNKNFIVITILYLLGLSFIDIVNNYIGMHFVNELNVPSSKVALYTLIMIAPELMILTKGAEILDFFGWKKFYMITAIGQIIRFLGYSLTGNIYLFYLATITHGLSVLMSAVCNIKFMNKKIDQNLLSTAISTYGSITLITQALYNKIFGLLIDSYGTYAIFYTGLFASILLLIIVSKTKIFDDM